MGAMGVVDVLLVARDCASHGISLMAKDWQALAKLHGTTVIEIEDRSEGGTHFCKSFGVGACLRWPVDPELFEEMDVEPDHEASDVAASESHYVEGERSLEASVDGAASHECDAAKSACSRALSNEQPERVGAIDGPVTDAPTACRNILPWLGGALQGALGGESAAEALSMCAEVILTDESTDWSDAVSQAASILLAEGVPQ